MEKVIKTLTPRNITIIILSLILVVAPMIVDKDSLPMGWELPKVQAIQIGAIVLVASYAVGSLFDLFISRNKIEFTWETLFVQAKKTKVILPLLIVLVTSIWFLIAYTQSPYSEIALNGNIFREMGLITVILIMLGGFVVFKSVDEKNIHFVGFALIVGAVIQASIGLQQFYDLYSSVVSHDRIYEGFWVYGTFGQTNFFAGYLLVGLVFAFYYLATESKFQVLLSMLAIVIISAGIFSSYSIWAYLMVFFVAFMVVVEMIPTKSLFKRFMIILPSVSVFLLFITMIFEPIRSYFPEVTKSFESRIVIWDSVIKVYSSSTSYTLFGTGFDTLGEVLRDNAMMPGAYIDRAHNVLIDIYSNVGIVGLAVSLCSILIIFALTLLKKELTRLDYYALIALQVVLLRAMIHTSSVINTFLMVVVISVAFSFSLNRKKLLEAKKPIQRAGVESLH